MTRKRLVIANWKMNPETLTEAKKVFSAIKRSAKKCRKVQTVVCPTLFHLTPLLSIKKAGVALGAQDVFWEQRGSYTGEVSAIQLSNEKTRYCLVGHSERRELGETDEQINLKIKALLKVGVIPVLCIGEKRRDEDGFYLANIKDQLKQALSGIKPKDFSKIVIAYEPIWAIGKDGDEAITGPQLHQMSLYIRKVISDLYTQRSAFRTLILYGGSVDEINARGIIEEGEVQGFLVGRASLDPKGFTKIIQIVNSL